MMETTRDLLAAQPFLNGLTDHQLERLSYWGQRSMFHAGNRIFAEGGHCDRFWLILRGRVDLDTQIAGRGNVVVETLGPGAVLGWSWLFPPYRWHFGAVAVENTFTVALDARGIRELCDQDPVIGYELTRRFIQVVVERLQASRTRLLDLDREPA
jgi:CRP/FNR family transcriptional regulator, cyclic AMP receptor protein